MNLLSLMKTVYTSRGGSRCFFNMSYEIQTVIKPESSLTGKSVCQIVIEKTCGETMEKIRFCKSDYFVNKKTDRLI